MDAAELEPLIRGPALSDGAAEETLDAVVDRGRYAEIFARRDQAEMLGLEDPKG
jgi:hypothetical protein